MATTMTIGRSASSPSLFAAALLLASVQQHREGGLFHFAHASENIGDIDSAANIGAATATQTQRRRRTPGRAPGANPFLPDYMTLSCNNDKAADAWMIDPPSTVGECCERHFPWGESKCEVVSQQWLMDQMGNSGSDISGGVGGAFGGNAFDSNGASVGVVVEYYPDSNLFVCKVVTAFTPSWITARENDYEDCCNKWFKFNLADCLDASPLTPVSGVLSNAVGDGSSSGNGGNNNSSNNNDNNNNPANTITANNWGFPTHCEKLTEKHCKHTRPYCSWMKDPGGKDFCASPYFVNAEGYSYYCSGRERDDCEGEQRCEFNKKKGCLAMVGSGVGNGGDSNSGDSNSGDRGGEGTPGGSNSDVDADNANHPCQSLAYKECTARVDVCQWNTKNESCTALPKPNSSNANNTDNNSPTCVSFNWRECVACPNECKWRKKKGCLPSSPKSNNINDASNKGNTTPRTVNPTPSPTPSPVKTQWHFNPGDGMCKPNGKARPKRIETVYDDYEECCGNSGNYAKCMNEVVGMLTENADNGDGDVEGGDEDGGDEAKKYWYNSRDGMCKPDGRKRPKWVTTLYEDFEECCNQSWAVSTCFASKHNPDKDTDSGGEDVDSNSGNLRGPRDM